MSVKQPVFFMPFLMPGRNVDWQTFFKNKADVSIGVGPVDQKKGKRFTLAPGESKQLYALTDGVLLILKKNEQLQDGLFDYTAKNPAIIIKTMPSGKLANASKALSLPNYIIYENIDLKRLKTDLLNHGGPIKRYVSKAVYRALTGKLIKADKKIDLLEKLIKDYAEKLFPKAASSRKQFYTVPVRCGEAIGQMKEYLDFMLAAVVPGNTGQQNRIAYMQVAEVLHKIAHYEKKLNKHPLLGKLSIKGKANFYLRFEVWDEKRKKSEIFSKEVIMHLSGKSYQPKSSSNDTGLVHFELSETQIKGSLGKTLFFKIGGAGPETYSTRNLVDINGVSGVIENYYGLSMGTPQNPIVFRLKIKKQIQLFYHKTLFSNEDKDGVIVPGAKFRRTKLAPFPPGVLVTIEEKFNQTTRTQTVRTDSKGALESVFKNFGDSSMDIVVHSDVYDKKESLPRTHIFRAKRPKRNVYDLQVPVAKIEERFRFSTAMCRMPESSLVVSRDHHYFNASIYAIKILWETHLWLRMMTQNEWKGMPIRILMYEFKGKKKAKSYARITTKTSKSTGHYETWIDLSNQWSRETLVHELGHCVSYQALQVDVNNFGTYFPLNKDGNHHLNVISDPNTAFIEGWPEFMCQVMNCSDKQKSADRNELKEFLKGKKLEYIEEYATGVKKKRAPYKKWGESPKLLRCRQRNQDPCKRYRHNNLGHYVEGAFAGALLNVFDLFFTSHSKGKHYANESVNGNIFESNKYLKLSRTSEYPAKDFYDLIWTAFKSLRQYSVGSDRVGLSAERFLFAVIKLAELHRNPTVGTGYSEGLRNLMNEFNTMMK